MLFWLFQLKEFSIIFNLFRYITFRASMAAVTTFVLCLLLGNLFIKKYKHFLQEKVKRSDAPQLDQFQKSKEGIPTMGGIFIVGSIVISVLLWADLTNPFIILTLLTCVWLAGVGLWDDYIKLRNKETKKGQRGLTKRTKLLWQILIGCIVGVFVYLDPGTSTQLDIPFTKSLVIDLGIFYIPFVALIVIGTSNAVNFTDGLDGLAIGCVLMASIGLAILCYLTGNIKICEYLLIPHIPFSGELTVFCTAIIGASLGFLWFNCFPATVFMGDVGSLALGGILGIIAVLIKKELLLIILGGVFVIEALSVILQIIYFKVTHKRFFKMSPFHHHLQLSGWNESKIIVRFWILAIIFVLLTLTTLKLR